MTVSDDQVAPYMAQFIDMLDTTFHRYGVAAGLPAPFREAVTATPRHGFVHRFKIDNGPLRDSSVNLIEDLPVIYSDAIMRHVDAVGEPLPSSNSQPSYILFLLHLLGVERGQRVLEIGSGSGWLAAIMARLVGPDGHVTGVELIPDLAAQSRADLAAVAIDNVEIITGDGNRGAPAEAPNDRAIVTAATWDVPMALLEQLADGGRVLIPIELRGGDGCAVTVLRRRGDILVAERTIPGWFVPLLGDRQGGRDTSVADLPDDADSTRYSLPLGMSQLGGEAWIAREFRAFLGRTEPGFVTLNRAGDSAPRSNRAVPPFGVTDEASGSLAIWQNGEIVSYRGRPAATRLAADYANWASFGLPGMSSFDLEVHPATAVPAAAERSWFERRGETVLVWRLELEVGGWRTLVAAEG